MFKTKIWHPRTGKVLILLQFRNVNSNNLWLLRMAVNRVRGSSPVLSTATFLTLLMGFSKSFWKFNKFMKLWPGEEKLGPYRFLPIFFLSGAALEYCMIHWRPNGVNFYDTFKAKQAKKLALQKWEKWKEIEATYK